MQRYKKEFRKRIGPGGLKCACCAPALGKPRQNFKRQIKRSDTQRVKLALKQGRYSDI